MHRVVALAAPGVAPFELGIVVEVFGLARPELDVPWWYELLGLRRAPGSAAGDRGRLRVRRRPRPRGARRSADTIVVPGWHERGLTRGGRRPSARRTSAARGSSRSAAGCSSSPPRACSTAGRRRRTGATRRRSRAGIREVRVNADVLYVDAGRRADVGGQRRGDRPVPAHRPPRPRQRRRQRRRAAARDPAAPRRRPGAADRPADARAPGRRPDRAHDGLGARAPRRAAGPGGARGPRVHERAHLHPPLPPRHRHDAGALAARAARAREPAAAGGLGRVDRGRGRTGRLRQCGDVPASLRRDHAHVADGATGARSTRPRSSSPAGRGRARGGSSRCRPGSAAASRPPRSRSRRRRRRR